MTRVARLPFVTENLARIAIWVAERDFANRWLAAFAAWAFFLARDFRYWRGVQEAGGVPRKNNPVLILCYHAIADLAGDPVLGEYGMPPDALLRQIETLSRRGTAFLSGAEFDRFMRGEAGVPRRAVLLTFDDCYRDLLEVAAPMLKARGIAAIAFAVTGLGSNVWDQKKGARALPLLDRHGLAALQRCGFELGAHSRTHEALPWIDAKALIEQVAGAAADMAAMGFDRPRFFAYPYGEENSTVQRTVAAAGYSAAFGLYPGFCYRTMDAMALPRLEIERRDQGWRFALKTRFPRLAPLLARY
jgi:peptidoglycan/xylan/chitin deacetylase (PgdA/CDA1 family)